MTESKSNLAAARLHISLGAVVQNWKTLNSLSGTAQTGAAIKANAYGLGAKPIAKALYDAGCRDFFVANWEEASELINIIPENIISVLNGVNEEDIDFATAHDFKPVLNSEKQISLWKNNSDGKICDVMLDSGINRLGLDYETCENISFSNLNIDTVMSHLASADEDRIQNKTQLDHFLAMSEKCSAKRRSLANSAAIMLGSDYHFDLTRPGLSLYGGIARPELKGRIQSVLAIDARVLQVKHLKSGDKVGYNATYICPEDMPIATIAMGYADGYLRTFSNKGTAYYEEVTMPIIGRVSMDLIAVDARENPNIGEGDWVELDYNLANASIVSGLSQYELLTNLGDRYQRFYET